LHPIGLHVGLEGALVPILQGVPGAQVVSRESALGPLQGIHNVDVQAFPFNDERLATPANEPDDVFKWVNESITAEMKRLNEWDQRVRSNWSPGHRCSKLF